MLVFRSVGRSTTLVQTEISQQQLDVMNFYTDIHGSWRMNLSDLGEYLNFSQPAGQSFVLSCAISQNLLDRLVQTFLQIFVVTRG